MRQIIIVATLLGFALSTKPQDRIANSLFEFINPYLQMKTVLKSCFVLLIALLMAAQVSAQTEQEKKKVRFRVENIAVGANATVVQYTKGRVYIPKFAPQNGGSIFSGFERQAVGYAFEVFVSYDLIRKKGFHAGLGIGFRSRSELYKGLKDSLEIINPGSDVYNLRDTKEMVELVAEIGYTFKQKIRLEGRVLVAAASRGKIASTDTVASLVDRWRPFTLSQTILEMRVGYSLRVKAIELMPSFSVGGNAWNEEDPFVYYGIGLIIRYHPK